MRATANAEFKSRYRKYFDVALMVSVLLTLMAFAFVPAIEIDGFRTDREELEAVLLEKDFVLPTPPKAIQRPQIPVGSLDEEVPEDATIADNALGTTDGLRTPPPPPRGDFQVFDRMPRPLRRVKPDYPAMAREAEIEGVVTLRVTIDEHGRVVSVSVIHSDSEVLNRAAVEAMEQWTFVPAQQSGIPVKATISVPLGFSLQR